MIALGLGTLDSVTLGLSLCKRGDIIWVIVN